MLNQLSPAYLLPEGNWFNLSYDSIFTSSRKKGSLGHDLSVPVILVIQYLSSGHKTSNSILCPEDKY